MADLKELRMGGSRILLAKRVAKIFRQHLLLVGVPCLYGAASVLLTVCCVRCVLMHCQCGKIMIISVNSRVLNLGGNIIFFGNCIDFLYNDAWIKCFLKKWGGGGEFPPLKTLEKTLMIMMSL